MDTIDAILQAAYDLFSTRSFERTPVSEIAKRAGVAAGTIIYHFKTKENLLRVLNWFTLNRLYSDIRQRTQAADDGLSAIILYIDEFFSSLESRSREITLLMETFSHSSGRQPEAGTLNMDINITTFRNGLCELLETLVRDGRADGSIPPVETGPAALGIMALLIGSARLALFHGLAAKDLRNVAEAYARAHLEPPKCTQRHDTGQAIG